MSRGVFCEAPRRTPHLPLIHFLVVMEPGSTARDSQTAYDLELAGIRSPRCSSIGLVAPSSISRFVASHAPIKGTLAILKTGSFSGAAGVDVRAS